LNEVGSVYITRKIETTVQNISRTFPVLMLTGPRQSGKTTMLNRLREDGRKDDKYYGKFNIDIGNSSFYYVSILRK